MEHAQEHRDSRKEAALELTSAAAATVQSVMQTFGMQLLNNADQVCQCIEKNTSLTSQEKSELLSLLEHMIKAPFRRQVGRLKSAFRSFDEVKKKINSL